MRKILGAIAIIEALLFFADPVMATALDPHAYTLYRTYANIPLHGLSFTSQNTGEDLQNFNETSEIITKEGWLNIKSLSPIIKDYDLIYSEYYSVRSQNYNQC